MPRKVGLPVSFARAGRWDSGPAADCRWINKLNPSISKLEWTDKDGEKLFGLHKIHGSSWKNISSQFKGRTDNFLKNQFFSLVRRALRRLTRFLEIPKGASAKSVAQSNSQSSFR